VKRTAIVVGIVAAGLLHGLTVGDYLGLATDLVPEKVKGLCDADAC
jgi:hypothetical protein